MAYYETASGGIVELRHVVNQRSYHIVLLPGDGIGPEVVRAARHVMEVAVRPSGPDVTFQECAFGGAATDKTGSPLPKETLEACLASDGILMGAVGGPAWDHLSREKRPEYGLLSLRKALGTYANLRPVVVPDALAHTSPLRRTVVAGTDLLVVRELTGGIYYGEPRGREGNEAFNTLRYSEEEVKRIARVAFEWARRRRRSVVSVDKSNVMEVSVLWREVVSRIQREAFPDVNLKHMYVDNAAMQIVMNPLQFDVILTGNMFGDILSDLSGTLIGSLGMLPSACVGGRVGIFEPVHGSAPELAGTDQANPLAAILSSAMLFDELEESAISKRIRMAVSSALDDGWRTEDIGRDEQPTVGTAVLKTARTSARKIGSTMKMAEEVANRLSEASVH